VHHKKVEAAPHCSKCSVSGLPVSSAEGIMRNAFALSGHGSYDGKAHGQVFGAHGGHKFGGFGKSYGGQKKVGGGFGHHGIAKRSSHKKSHSGFNDNSGVFTNGFGAGRYGRPNDKKVKYGGPISGKPQANLSFNRHASKKSNPFGSLDAW